MENRGNIEPKWKVGEVVTLRNKRVAKIIFTDGKRTKSIVGMVKGDKHGSSFVMEWYPTGRYYSGNLPAEFDIIDDDDQKAKHIEEIDSIRKELLNLYRRLEVLTTKL